jgi:hypothetical protein
MTRVLIYITEGKRSKVSSKVFLIKANKLSKQSNLQLSLPKETAFPRKSRYDKGKNKVSQDLLESLPPVGPLGPLRTTDEGEKITILDLLTGTHSSREITIPFEENSPSVSEPLRVAFPPPLSSAIIPVESSATRETQEPNHAEAEAMEPSIFDEMDRGGASSSLPEFMDDEVTRFSRENSTGDPIFVEYPTPTRPLNSQTSRESIKFARETINWVGDPLEAFAGLIPVSPRQILLHCLARRPWTKCPIIL